jgi:hypothetical protein
MATSARNGKRVYLKYQRNHFQRKQKRIIHQANKNAQLVMAKELLTPYHAALI